ncbi:MAG: CvpA family protein, partial [Pseudomonadota bacterium]
LLLTSTLFAFLNGFINSSLSFIVWVGSLILSLIIGPMLQPYVAQHFTNRYVSSIITGIITYAIIMIILALIAKPIREKARKYVDSLVDRSLGVIFGFARGMFIICVFVIVTMFVNGFITGNLDSENVSSDENAPEWLLNAKTYSFVNISTETLLSILPDDLLSFTAKLLLPEVVNEEILDNAENKYKNTMPKVNIIKEHTKYSEIISKTQNDKLSEILSKDSLNKVINDNANNQKNSNVKNINHKEGYDPDTIEQINQIIQQTE